MSLKSLYAEIESRRDAVLAARTALVIKNNAERDKVQRKIRKMEEQARKLMESSREEQYQLDKEAEMLGKVDPELIELRDKADRLDEQIRMLSMYDLRMRNKVDLSMPDKVETYQRGYGPERKVEFLGEIEKDDYSVLRAYAVGNDKKVNGYTLVYLGKSVFFKSQDYGLRIKDDRQFGIQLQGRSLPSPEALKPFVRKDWENSKVWEKYKLALLDFSLIIKELSIDEVPVSILPYRCKACGNVITKRQLNNWSDGYDFENKCPACEAKGFDRQKASERKAA